MRLKKNKKGQSTVEYILLVTAVIAVIIVFVTSNNSGGFRAQLNTTLNTVTGDIGTETDALDRSHALANGEAGASTPPYSVNVAP